MVVLEVSENTDKLSSAPSIFCSAESWQKMVVVGLCNAEILVWGGPLAVVGHGAGGVEHKKGVGVIVRVHAHGQVDLMQIAGASGAAALFLGAGQSRQEHASQNGYDRDHHQQFDEREPGAWPAIG